MMSLVVRCLSSPHSSLFTTFCGLRLASGNIRLFSSSLTFSGILYGLNVILRLEIKMLRSINLTYNCNVYLKLIEIL